MKMKHLQELEYLKSEHLEIVTIFQITPRENGRDWDLSPYNAVEADKKDIYDEYDALRYLTACESMVNDDRYDRTTRPLKKPKAEVAKRAFQRHLAVLETEETYMRENRSDYKKSSYDVMRDAVHYYIDRFSDEEWVKALPKKILKPNEIRELEAKEQEKAKKREQRSGSDKTGGNDDE